MKLRQILISAKLICQYRALRRYIYIAAVEAIFFGIFPKLLMESQKNGVFGNNLLKFLPERRCSRQSISLIRGEIMKSL